MFPRLADRRNHFGALPNGCSGQVKRICKLHEVWAVKRRGFVASLVEKFLPLPHHTQITVVDNGNLDIKAFLRDGGKFGHRHLKATVASHNPDLRVRPCKLGADRGGQSEAHRA